MSRLRRSPPPALALAAILAAAPAMAEPPPPPVAAAQEKADREKRAVDLHDEARELYAHGQYRAAIARLEAALLLDPEGRELVYNLALIHERLGEIDAAVRDYQRYLEMETSPREREKVQAILRRLEGAKTDLAPPPLPPPPPPPPPPPRARPLPPAPRATSPWVYVSGAVGATGLFAGVVLGISAVARYPGSHPTTRPGVSADDLLSDARAAHHQAVLADVSLITGALAAGAAIVLYYATRGEPHRPAPVTAHGGLRFGPTAIGVTF